MANTKISQAYSKPDLEPTDMIPVAEQGALTPYHITGQALFDSLRPASTADRGVVGLATAAEAAAGADTERALTPASLANAIGPKMIADGVHYIGYHDYSPGSAVQVCNLFATAVGRAVAHGDMMIWDGGAPDYGFYVGFFHVAAGKIYAFNMRTGTFLSIS